MGGEERERGPQSPFVGWILINSTKVLALNNKMKAGAREDLLCEVEKRKKLKGKKLLQETLHKLFPTCVGSRPANGRCNG